VRGGRSGSRGRTASYALMALAVVVALAIGVVDQRDDRSTEERMQDIAATIRCPQCRSQSAADSDASTAQAVRVEITERIDEGQSDDEIRDYFASTYGEEILLTPPASGVGSLVWIVPVVALVAGAGGLWVAFRRWRRWT
jgi:cytochrome c-type biogenesis protein CcmH